MTDTDRNTASEFNEQVIAQFRANPPHAGLF